MNNFWVVPNIFFAQDEELVEQETQEIVEESDVPSMNPDLLDGFSDILTSPVGMLILCGGLGVILLGWKRKRDKNLQELAKSHKNVRKAGEKRIENLHKEAVQKEKKVEQLEKESEKQKTVVEKVINKHAEDIKEYQEEVKKNPSIKKIEEEINKGWDKL